MKSIIVTLLAVIFFVSMRYDASAQLIGVSNLGRYNSVNIYVELDKEVLNTFLETPVTSNTVGTYITQQLSNNGISSTIVQSMYSSPVLRVRLQTFSINVVDCSVTCLNLAGYVYETYDEKRFISWNWGDRPYITINLKADGKAAGFWESLGMLVTDFAAEWKKTH